jgi:hypothetical protein
MTLDLNLRNNSTPPVCSGSKKVPALLLKLLLEFAIASTEIATILAVRLGIF